MRRMRWVIPRYYKGLKQARLFVVCEVKPQTCTPMLQHSETVLTLGRKLPCLVHCLQQLVQV